MNPNLFAAPYYLSIYGQTPGLTGLHTVALVPDITYYLDDGAFALIGTANSAVYFAVDGAGGANTLTLQNVLVHIDPGAYTGSYRVLTGDFVSGPTDVDVIRGLLAYVLFDAGVNYFVAEPNQITAASASLAPFALSLPLAVTVSGVAPATLVQGAGHQTVTVTGTNFAPGASVTIGPTGITVHTVTFVSATSLRADVSVAATAPTGPQDVTVINADGFGGLGGGLLTVLSPQGYTTSVIAQIQGLVSAGQIPQGAGRVLTNVLTAATRLIGVNNNAARALLNLELLQLNLLVRARRITPAVRDTLASEINALISSVP